MAKKHGYKKKCPRGRYKSGKRKGHCRAKHKK